MSEEKKQSTPLSKNPVSKETHIQEGYTPPPMATILQPDEARGYTPPPMPTVLKPQASPALPPSSAQPAAPQPPSASQTPPAQPPSNQDSSGGPADSK